MKRGTKVWVIHDGKWGRRVPGTVVRQHNGHHITVQFEYSRDEGTVTLRARRRGPQEFGGWADDYIVFNPWFLVTKMEKK